MAEPFGVQVKILRVVTRDALMTKPLRNYFNRLIIMAHADVIKPGHVPIDEGFLKGSLAPGGGTTRIDDASPPKWAVYGTNLDYGGVLNAGEDKRGRIYHYADGPSAGQPTAGWLSNTLDNISAGAADARTKLAAEMREVWG